VESVRLSSPRHQLFCPERRRRYRHLHHRGGSFLNGPGFERCAKRPLPHLLAACKYWVSIARPRAINHTEGHTHLSCCSQQPCVIVLCRTASTRQECRRITRGRFRRGPTAGRDEEVLALNALVAKRFRLVYCLSGVVPTRSWPGCDRALGFVPKAPTVGFIYDGSGVMPAAPGSLLKNQILHNR